MVYILRLLNKKLIKKIKSSIKDNFLSYSNKPNSHIADFNVI